MAFTELWLIKPQKAHTFHARTQVAGNDLC